MIPSCFQGQNHCSSNSMRVDLILSYLSKVYDEGVFIPFNYFLHFLFFFFWGHTHWCLGLLLVMGSEIIPCRLGGKHGMLGIELGWFRVGPVEGKCPFRCALAPAPHLTTFYSVFFSVPLSLLLVKGHWKCQSVPSFWL